MTTITLYRIYIRGEPFDFLSREAAQDEQLYFEVMRNLSPPLYIVERDYVDEQLVNEREIKL